jgi:hypothetical protein
MATFVDVLQSRADAKPDARAYLFLHNGEEESVSR